jgi:hypothetical protein
MEYPDRRVTLYRNNPRFCEPSAAQDSAQLAPPVQMKSLLEVEFS